MRLPHRFRVFGAPWRMRWGDTSRKDLDCKEEWGACIDEKRLIILNPEIRGRALKSAEVFAHELQHAFNAEVKRRMVSMQREWDLFNAEQARCHLKQRKGWKVIPHAAIGRYELAWGAFLSENNVTFTESVQSPQPPRKKPRPSRGKPRGRSRRSS